MYGAQKDTTELHVQTAIVSNMFLFRYKKISRRTRFGTSRPLLHGRQHGNSFLRHICTFTVLARPIATDGSTETQQGPVTCASSMVVHVIHSVPKGLPRLFASSNGACSKELGPKEGVALQQLADLSFPQPIDVVHSSAPHAAS